jgi:hypothetical protein
MPGKETLSTGCSCTVPLCTLVGQPDRIVTPHLAGYKILSSIVLRKSVLVLISRTGSNCEKCKSDCHLRIQSAYLALEAIAVFDVCHLEPTGKTAAKIRLTINAVQVLNQPIN